MVRKDYGKPADKHHHWWKETHRVDKTIFWTCMSDDCDARRTTRSEPLPWMS